MKKINKEKKINRVDNKIFKEYDIRGKSPEQLSEPFAYALGLALAKLSKAKKIIVGRDARIESEQVFWPFLAGLTHGGFLVEDIGVCSTAELFFAVGIKGLDLGVMITASHNPAGQTGFKFSDNKFLALGKDDRFGKLKQQVEKELKNLKGKKKFEPLVEKVKFVSVAKDYRDFALSFIETKKIAGLKIVLDASNGSGGRLAETVFSALPVTAQYVNFKPDMISPDHGLNPMLKENRRTITRQVLKHQADLGVIFDGDADRALFIDEQGKFIEPYYINCLFAEIILSDYKNKEFLIDGRLGLLLAKIIKNSGGKVVKQRSGYVNFIKTMMEKRVLFGCENSGHFLLNLLLKKKNCFIWSDAIIPVLLVSEYLKIHQVKLSQIIDGYKNQAEISGEINLEDVDFSQVAVKLKKKYAGNSFEEFDGLSVISSAGDWFFNVRPSQTEPLVRINIEAENKTKMLQLKKELLKLIKS